MKPLATLAAAALAGLALAAPVKAGGADAEVLVNLLEKSGTEVSFNTNKFDKNCINNKGYYIYEHKVQDLLVVCVDQVNTDDGEEVWEVLAHETTHAMQACMGGTVFETTYHPRFYRELGRKAPHSAELLNKGYGHRDAASEVEAFWMELQSPEKVMNLFVEACLKTN